MESDEFIEFLKQRSMMLSEIVYKANELKRKYYKTQQEMADDYRNLLQLILNKKTVDHTFGIPTISASNKMIESLKNGKIQGLG